jgi:hypothetical protein
MRNFIICTPCQIALGELIKEDEIDKACSTHGGKVERKRTLGRSKRRCEVNIKYFFSIYLQGVSDTRVHDPYINFTMDTTSGPTVESFPRLVIFTPFACQTRSAGHVMYSP